MLQDRLGLILEWYTRMISDRTGRLVYSYEPLADAAVSDGSDIRNIASIWDMEILSDFLGRAELMPVIERSLRHYADYLTPHHDALILDPARLEEPSGIAHSAFMLLAVSDAAPGADIPQRQLTIDALAEGLLHQQREDGSYRIYFGGEPDDGLEFYPGEAMLALMRVHACAGGDRYLHSVERGFQFCHDNFPADAVVRDLRIFYANWQSQYAALLHEKTSGNELRMAVAEYIFSLHDRAIRERFYEDVERFPMQQATVEIACALEGLNDAYAIAVREGDGERRDSYERCIRTSLAWLLRAQRMDQCTPRERGGFGHSLTSRTQRIDVTGHVAGGFIKCLRNGIGV